MKMAKCECGCGNRASIVRKDLDSNVFYFLCHNCEINLINLNLSKKQFKHLLENGHKPTEFMLHSDFYTEEGEALQPRW